MSSPQIQERRKVYTAGYRLFALPSYNAKIHGLYHKNGHFSGSLCHYYFEDEDGQHCITNKYFADILELLVMHATLPWSMQQTLVCELIGTLAERHQHAVKNICIKNTAGDPQRVAALFVPNTPNPASLHPIGRLQPTLVRKLPPKPVSEWLRWRDPAGKWRKAEERKAQDAWTGHLPLDQFPIGNSPRD